MDSQVLPLFSSISASFASFRGGRLSCSVVIVCPDEDLRHAICWVLELLGSTAWPCDPDEASLMLAREPMDLVLCNLDVAGALLETLQTVAALLPPIVLLCEKRMDKRMLSACLNAGAKSYITKPLRIQAIRGVIIGHVGAAPETPMGVEGARTPHDKGYEKIRELGRGTYGEVSLVQRRRDGARFALKELITDRLSATEQRRVLDELRLHRAFDCPSVVRYYTSWMQGDVAYLLLEYIANGSLSTRVDKCRESKTEISDSAILDYAGQILIGLLYLHRKEVVHRDLKLENVLGPENSGRIKIADFGISKRLNGQEMLRSKVGTPEIMAPERCVESAPGGETPGYGPESDLWSLGVILYELATLRPPFSLDESTPDGPSYLQRLEQLFERIRVEEPSPLPFSRHATLHKIINGGLLRKRPQDRPSASDLCRDPALGAAMHRFLKKHKLLEHPSILEILDVLPSGAMHGGSRIESSDIDVWALQRYGTQTGTARSYMACSWDGPSFLDRSRMSEAELKNNPGVTDTLRGFIAEANSSQSATVDAAREKTTCANGDASPIRKRAEASEMPSSHQAAVSHSGVNSKSNAAHPTPHDGDDVRLCCDAGAVAPTPESADATIPFLPDASPLGNVQRPQVPPSPPHAAATCGMEFHAPEPVPRKRQREKLGPVSNYHTHPQDIDHMHPSPTKGNASPGGIAASPVVPELVPASKAELEGCKQKAPLQAGRAASADPTGDISNHGAENGRQRSKRGAPRCLDPLDPMAKKDASLHQVSSSSDLHGGACFRTPRQPERRCDRELGSGDGTGRSSSRSSSVTGSVTARSGKSMGQRSASAVVLQPLTSSENHTSTAAVSSSTELPQLSRQSLASSLAELDNFSPEFASGGSSSSNARTMRQARKLSPMRSGQPNAAPRLLITSTDISDASPSSSTVVLGTIGKTPSPLRAIGKAPCSYVEPPLRIRGGKLSNEFMSSPMQEDRSSEIRGADLAYSQGASAATRARRMNSSSSTPALTLGLGPAELDADSLDSAGSESTGPSIPVAPRSLNKCKSDAVMSRADALLSRSTATSSEMVRTKPGRNGVPAMAAPSDQPPKRSNPGTKTAKAEGAAYDAATAWGPGQAHPEADMLN